MKKLIDIMIIVGLTILVINLFSSKEKEVSNNELVFSTTKNSYTIPASVGLNIANDTSNKITLNTCNDIKINFSGKELVFNDDFCEDVNIESGEKTMINYSDEYDIFGNIGDYVFKINLEDKEYIEQFEINNPGTIKKIFVYLFYAPIYNLMIFLIKLFGGYLGGGIISITIIIRLLLVYPQHKMMLSQKKLQAIQPKIKEIQEKYKGQQQVLGVKLMELYKKEKVNPMGSCGFLLIQMPILLVVYRIILGIQDLSNYYYLYPMLSDFNLETVNYSFLGLDLLGRGGTAGVLLALFVGGVQFLQIKLSLANKEKDDKKVVLEKKKGDTDYSQFMPEPEMMNKFMLFGMPIMVAMFTFNLFAGVGIYWGISTLFMVFQQLFVNVILKKVKQ